MTSFKRGRVRSKVKAKINIKTDKFKITDCESKDISLNGLYIISKEKPSVDTNCTITLILINGLLKPIHLNLSATVIRQQDDGFAVNFTEMDDETYYHLQNLVKYNAENPEEVIKECKKRIGFK